MPTRARLARAARPVRRHDPDAYVPTLTPAEQQKAKHLRASMFSIEDAGYWWAVAFRQEAEGNADAAAYSRRAAEAAMALAREEALNGYAVVAV